MVSLNLGYVLTPLPPSKQYPNTGREGKQGRGSGHYWWCVSGAEWQLCGPCCTPDTQPQCCTPDTAPTHLVLWAACTTAGWTTENSHESQHNTGWNDLLWPNHPTSILVYIQPIFDLIITRLNPQLSPIQDTSPCMPYITISKDVCVSFSRRLKENKCNSHSSICLVTGARLAEGGPCTQTSNPFISLFWDSTSISVPLCLYNMDYVAFSCLKHT